MSQTRDGNTPDQLVYPECYFYKILNEISPSITIRDICIIASTLIL